MDVALLIIHLLHLPRKLYEVFLDILKFKDIDLEVNIFSITNQMNRILTRNINFEVHKKTSYICQALFRWIHVQSSIIVLHVINISLALPPKLGLNVFGMFQWENWNYIIIFLNKDQHLYVPALSMPSGPLSYDGYWQYKYWLVVCAPPKLLLQGRIQDFRLGGGGSFK